MLTIKKLKLFQGMEGEGFNLDLYLNGKKIAFVMDGGNGGVFNYDFISPAAATEFVGIVNAMPPIPIQDESWRDIHPDGLIPVTIDMAVDELINAHNKQKRVAKMKKTAVVFTTAACRSGDFMSVKHDNADTELLKFAILKKHPDAVFI
jgi:hypothetical protein